MIMGNFEVSVSNCQIRITVLNYTVADLHKYFPTCQVVESISMTNQFHKFSYVPNFWRDFVV